MLVNRVVALLQLCESLESADQNFRLVRNPSYRLTAVWEQIIGPRSPPYTATSDKAKILPDSKMSHAAP